MGRGVGGPVGRLKILTSIFLKYLFVPNYTRIPPEGCLEIILSSRTVYIIPSQNICTLLYLYSQTTLNSTELNAGSGRLAKYVDSNAHLSGIDSMRIGVCMLNRCCESKVLIRWRRRWWCGSVRKRACMLYGVN